MKSVLRKYRSLQFWLGLVIPIVFILVSVNMMKNVREKRDRIARNVSLVSQFSQLEDEFNDIELKIVDPADDEANKHMIKRQGIRIQYALDTMDYYLNGDLPSVKSHILEIDSITREIMELKLQLLLTSSNAAAADNYESEIRNKVGQVIKMIKTSVVEIRKDMTMLSIQLNAIWIKMFYLLIGACVIAFLLVIFLILYRRQLYTREQVESSLRASEKRNTALLDAIPDMMFMISKDGTYLDFKPSKEVTSIVSPDVFMGKNVTDFFPPEEGRQALHHIRKALETGRTQHYEYQLEEEGKLHHYEARVVKSGEDEVIGIIRDITERKKVEMALRTSEERYTMAVRSGNVGVWDWNLETNEIFVDPNLKKMLGYKDKEVRNHMDDWGALVHPDDRDKVMLESQAHIEGKKPSFNIEHRMHHKNGSIVWFSTNGKTVKDKSGKVNRMVGTDVNITDRKNAEDQLAESEAKWRSIIENVEDVIVNIDKQGRILSINKTNQGYTKEQLIGQDIFELLFKPDKSRIKEGVLNVFKTSKPYNYEVQFRGKDGSKVWYSNIATPIVKGKKVDSVIIVCRDVTPQKEAETAVINAMVEGQDKERKRISEELHDGLGQVLSTISMNFNALISKLKNNKLKEDDENLRNVHKLLNRTIKEVRSISHDLMPDILDEFGLEPALHDIADKLKGAKELSVDLEFVNMGQRLDKTVEVALYRMVQELLNNIVKHANATHAQVQIINHNDSVVLVVEDDGVGFNEEDRGNGIGIKNISSRARLLNGDVIIDSSKGKGTIITIELPLKTVSA